MTNKTFREGEPDWSNGAKGYVLKADAGNELWPAIQAVLQGKQFVSSGVRSDVKIGIAFGGGMP